MALGLSRGAGVEGRRKQCIGPPGGATPTPAAERTAELDAAFARHSLERDALQAAFVFVGSAAIAGMNALIDFIYGTTETLGLNAFLSGRLVGTTARIDVERMQAVANIMAGVTCAALLLVRLQRHGCYSRTFWWSSRSVLVRFSNQVLCAVLVLSSAAVLIERAPGPMRLGRASCFCLPAQQCCR